MNKDLSIKITADIKNATNKINELNTDIKKLGEVEKKASTSTEQLENNLNKIKKGSSSLLPMLGKLSTALGGTFLIKNAVEDMAEFQHSITKLGAVLQASATDTEALREKSIALGSTTLFTSSQVADGMNYLAMAGFKTNDILASMGDVLNIATIGQIDLGRASDIVSNILTGFNLKADQTSRVVDVMTATITNANTDIPMLGDAMKYVAPQAQAMGISIEDTATAIGVLSDAGLQGTLAGTGLAEMLTKMAAPVGKAKAALKTLGIKLYDSKGKFIGLTKALLQFNDKMKGLSDQAKMGYLKDIFGQIAAKDAITLIGNVKKTYLSLNEVVKNSQGLGKKVAKDFMNDLTGAYKALQSALDGLLQSIGRDLLPALTSMTKTLTKLVQGTKEFYNNNGALIHTLADIATQLIAVQVATKGFLLLSGGKSITEIGTMIEELGGFSAALVVLKTRMIELTAATLKNPLGIILTAIGVAYVAIDGYSNKLADANKRVMRGVTLLKASSQDLDKVTKSILSHGDKKKGFFYTKEELKTDEDNIQTIIKIQKKRLENLKKNNTGTAAYNHLINQQKNVIGLLQERLDLLHSSKIKIIKDDTKSLAAIDKATKANEKWINSVEERYKKQKEASKTLAQSYTEELDHLKSLKLGAEDYNNALTAIQGYYTKIRVRQVKKEYETRIQADTNTVETLKNKEKTLTDKILALNIKLQQQLKGLERDRINSIESINNKIHNLQLTGTSDYNKYLDKQKQAEERLSKAKSAIKAGELQEAKRYMNEYESLVSEIGNSEITKTRKVREYNYQTHKFEIKEVKDVVLSKKQASEEAIQDLERLKGVTNNYYAEAKAKARESYIAKMTQLKTELEATKAQLQLEVQRLNLEKQLIQVLTGRKITIDTSGAITAIKGITSQIKEIDRNISKSKKLRIDTAHANAKIQGIYRALGQLIVNKHKVTVYANTTPADLGIQKLISVTKGKKVEIKINPKYQEALKKIDEVKKGIKKNPEILNVKADTNEAVLVITDLKKKTKEKVIFNVNGDTKRAEEKIQKLKKPFETKQLVKINDTRAVAEINKLKQNTSSTHTIYVRTVQQHATGGFIRRQGALSGYGGGDRVKALLEDGEFIVRKEAVRQLGINRLQTINQGIIPKYATGGLVGIGTPQKLIEQLSNSFGKNDNGGNGLDSSNWDDLISKLRDLISGGTLPDKFNNIFKNMLSEAEKQQQHFSSIERNDQNNIKSAQNSTLGKIQTPEEAKKSQSVIASAQNKLQIDTNAEHKKLEEIKDKLADYSNRLKRYLLEVKTIKEKIESYLKTYYIDMPIDAKNSLDLERLERFKANIENPMKDYAYEPFITKSDAYKKMRQLYYNGSPSDKRFLLNKDFVSSSDIYNQTWYNEKYAKWYNTSILPKFKTGGLLKGYGGGDKNLSLLEDGEFVIRKEAVKTFGADLFRNLNNLSLPKFQTGGYVGTTPTQQNLDNVNLNFTLPSGNTYKTITSSEVAKALGNELRKML